MPKIKDSYRVFLGRDFQRFHIAAIEETAQEITLQRNIDNKLVFDNTVVSISGYELRTSIGDKDVNDVSDGKLTCTGIDFWQFELYQGSSPMIKSMQFEVAGTVTFKVYLNGEDGSLVVAGIASASPGKSGKK